MADRTIAQALAGWVNGLRYEDLASEIVSHARRCMLDTLGVQVRGATLPWVQPAYRYARTLGGTPEATITYHGERVSVPYAAYANSVFSYSCELQHHGSFGSAHTGVIVVPVVQAIGEALGASGREVIAAMAAGYEVQGRLGAALFEPLCARHFHPQGVLGVFSAAAAAGKLLGLTAAQQAHAFAIAGSHASAILEYDQAGGEVKRIHGAMAARSGIQSALLAREGLTGPLTVFEGRHGIFASFGGGGADPSSLIAGLGAASCITRCRYRIYPCIGSCHPALDIVGDLMKQQHFGYRDVEKIRVGMGALSVSHVTHITRPHDVISAQASLGYSLGLLLAKGGNDLDLYMDPRCWADPDILAISGKLEAYALKGASSPRATRVEIVLKDGRVLTGEQQDARGSDSMPFDDAVIETKFRRLAEALLPPQQADKIFRTVQRLEQLEAMSPLVALLRKNSAAK